MAEWRRERNTIIGDLSIKIIFYSFFGLRFSWAEYMEENI